MIEKTLVILKPDSVQRALVGEIIQRFEKCGLKIVALKMTYADKTLAAKHYTDDEEWLKSVGKKSVDSYKAKGIDMGMTELEVGTRIRNQLIDYISMSPTVAIVLEGNNAVAHVRKIVGPTSPEHAAPGTIRGDYSFDTYQLGDESNRPIQNLIHASESPKIGEQEIKLWFKPEELHVWQRIDEPLLYRKENKGD
ncbi:MAG: nucleoside-diphosphate kinase [archaeon]